LKYIDGVLEDWTNTVEHRLDRVAVLKCIQWVPGRMGSEHEARPVVQEPEGLICHVLSQFFEKSARAGVRVLAGLVFRLEGTIDLLL
jgi:hypothetical protein